VTMKLDRNISAHSLMVGLTENIPGRTEEKLQKLSIRLGVIRARINLVTFIVIMWQEKPFMPTTQVNI